jgi:hypothetical protein
MGTIREYRFFSLRNTESTARVIPSRSSAVSGVRGDVARAMPVHVSA